MIIYVSERWKIMKFFILTLSLSMGFLLLFKSIASAQTITPTPAGQLWLQTGNNIYNSNPGFVGIKTSNPVVDLNVEGRSAFGNNILQDYPFIGAQFDQSNAGNDSYRGLRSYLTQTAGGNINPIIAIDGACYYTSPTGNLQGCRGGDFSAISTSTGTVSNMASINTNVEIDSTGNVNTATLGQFFNFAFPYSGVSSTISNAYGVWAGVKKAGGGQKTAKITNGYGVYIDSVNAINSYGIYQADSTNNNYFAGNIGLGITNPSQKLEVNGGIRLNTTSGQPSCNTTTRGVMWFTQGGTGVKDTLSVCAKAASGVYAWRTLY